jgi:hypothetical protein
MSSLTPYEAQRQIMVLEKVLIEGPLPIGEFDADVVVSLVKVGLLAETDHGISATPAAVHYAGLVDAT